MSGNEGEEVKRCLCVYVSGVSDLEFLGWVLERAFGFIFLDMYSTV